MTTPSRWPRWHNATDGRHAASWAAGTPLTTRLSTGCRSPPIPGWAGFAIGRSIWWDPLRGHLSTAGEARHRIRAAYLDYARYYLKAREGTLPEEPDSAL